MKRVVLGVAAVCLASVTAGAAAAQQIDVGASPPADAANSQQTPAPETRQQTPDSSIGDTQHRPQTPASHPRQRDTSPSALIGDTQSAPPPGLIGDWQEIRTRLGRRGIGLTARYASESGYNFAGGTRNLFRETGQFDVGALLDLEKLVGLKGGAFQATVTWRRGYDLTTAAGINSLQQVQEVYGRGQTVRLTQFWYEQKIGRAVEIKLGRTNPGEDFAVFSCHFMNLSFCGAQPGNLVGDYWYNWPVSQWGARVRVDLPHDLYVQGGVYEINPRNLDNDFFIGHFKGATGALIPVEAGWTRGGDDGHVGSYKIGGWLGTADGNDVLLDVNRNVAAVTGLAPLQHSSRYGVYFTMQQQLTGTSKDGKSLTGLSMFANVTQADRKTSVTDNQVSVGVFYKGLVPAVPGDVLGLAVARTNVNGRAALADLSVPGTPVRHEEYAAEVYYSIHPADWLELRPNVQYIHQPGGIREANDVGVVGMKAAITL
ncbi:carbohydrate porin [Sphingomonas sp. MA1305]|uniref:carbohydrate porin n=1 Tax=Sphingomonas sp. MA1305 TaxID=2479204 RepID=UPI0018DF4739|nr:carbohydrate porin [Sphingomonas sp. MA1305]MBI0473872.1 carbohydrate porin [Sphingomonas sp. MA1305]